MNKRLRKILCILVLSGLSFGAFAGGLDNKNGIGTYVFLNDHPFGGFQYERRVGDSNAIGLKFGVSAFYDDDDKFEPLNYNLTFEFDYSIFQTTWKEKIDSRVFLFALVGYEGGIKRDYDNINRIILSDTYYSNVLACGGAGFEIIVFDHLSFPIQIGMSAKFPYEIKVGFTTGFGVRYTW
ncbi:MAG: hypothetical protein J6X54_00520 [Treponema sp.]|nr:hypothetical protein [Treponema sp.]